MNQRKPPGERSTRRGTDSRQRQHLVGVRLTAEEFALVKDVATRLGLTMPGALRYAIVAIEKAEKARLIDRILDAELPRYADALRRLGE